MTRPFTEADNGKRFTHGPYGAGRLEYPLTDRGSATVDEGILWYDTPTRRGWLWEYVKPIDVDPQEGV